MRMKPVQDFYGWSHQNIFLKTFLLDSCVLCNVFLLLYSVRISSYILFKNLSVPLSSTNLPKRILMLYNTLRSFKSFLLFTIDNFISSNMSFELLKFLSIG